jgi:hypothetical protein
VEKAVLEQVRAHMAGGQSLNIGFIVLSSFGAIVSLGIAGIVGHIKYVIKKIDESHKIEVSERNKSVDEIKVDISNLYDRLNPLCDLVNQMKGAHDRNHK